MAAKPPVACLGRCGAAGVGAGFQVSCNGRRAFEAGLDRALAHTRLPVQGYRMSSATIVLGRSQQQGETLSRRC